MSKSYPARHHLVSLQGDGPPDSDRFVALNEVSLDVGSGGSLGIVGESGAGKSTLASLITGGLVPDSGEVRFNGAVIGKETDNRSLAPHLQMIWQDARGSLDPRFKVRKSIAEPLKIHGLADDIHERVQALMDETGLNRGLADNYSHELSGGEVQRLVIARALALDPELLVCDEPASALDTISRKRIIDLLSRLRQERNLALIVISHDLPVVCALADHLVIMCRGEIVERGEAAKVVANPHHPYTKELINAVPKIPV